MLRLTDAIGPPMRFSLLTFGAMFIAAATAMGCVHDQRIGPERLAQAAAEFGQYAQIEERHMRCDRAIFDYLSRAGVADPHNATGEQVPAYRVCMEQQRSILPCEVSRQAALNASQFHRAFVARWGSRTESVVREWAQQCHRLSEFRTIPLWSAEEVVEQCRTSMSFLLMPVALNLNSSGAVYDWLPPSGTQAFHCGAGLTNIRYYWLPCRELWRLQSRGEPYPASSAATVVICDVLESGANNGGTRLSPQVRQ